MRAEKREVYISDDGKVFDTPAACQAHETKLIENARRLDALQVWIVRSGFDSTEGRGYHHTTYILTGASLPVIIEYCLDRFGKPLSGWYGDGFYEVWTLHKQDYGAEEALRRSKGHHNGIGLSNGAADLVFLSDTNIEHPDLPKRVFPWPKPPKEVPATPPPSPRKK